MANKQSNVEMANLYFSNQMKKVSVRRVEYNVTDTFEEYLSHRYRNNCYNYSAFAVMGLGKDDKLVRGDISLPDDDWRWCEGGYNHGWVEFLYHDEEFVFDSRCKDIMCKAEWYKKFKPEKMVTFTQTEIMSMILQELDEEPIILSDIHRMHQLQGDKRDKGNNCYKIKDTSKKQDLNHILKPLTKAIIYLNGEKIERFIAYRNPFE